MYLGTPIGIILIWYKCCLLSRYVRIFKNNKKTYTTMSKKLLILSLTTLPFTAFADHASIGLGVGLASPIATES
jgi:hypothetical protein